MAKLFRTVLAAAGIVSACTAAPELQSGDLVFVGIPAERSAEGMSGAIADATGSGEVNFIHTAIVDIDADGGVWIIDANTNHGVARTPLDEFIRDFTYDDGSYPVFDVMRLKNVEDASAFVENARTFIGLPYDLWFLPSNKAIYCSELVYEAYVTPDGEHLFSSAPMNFKSSDGSFPEYWVKLFQELGEPIPQDVPGTNPQDMHGSELLFKTNIDLPSLR